MIEKRLGISFFLIVPMFLILACSDYKDMYQDAYASMWDDESVDVVSSSSVAMFSSSSRRRVASSSSKEISSSSYSIAKSSSSAVVKSSSSAKNSSSSKKSSSSQKPNQYVSSSSVYQTSSATPTLGSDFGTCAPARTPIAKGDTVSWVLKAKDPTLLMNASTSWTMVGGTPDAVNAVKGMGGRTAQTKYAASGDYNASVQVSVGAANYIIQCEPLHVNGNSNTSCSTAGSTAYQFTYKVPKLTTLNSAKRYSFYGAELSGIEPFKYGRFEACMKMAAISGTVSSMFLYYDNSWIKEEEPWNEIDIEVLGKAADKWQSNIITREADPSIRANTSSESKPLHDFGFDATQDFHLYAIVWTPEYVAWEIDGVEVRRDTLGMSRGRHADADQVAFLTKELTFRFNLWASKSTAWTGNWDNGIGLPIEQQIDFVRVYSYNSTTKGFTKLWQDDFDGEDLNPQHWTKGDWEMERVMLRKDNVIVENGVCRLIMDYEAD